MSVGIMIITHGKTAEALLEEACFVHGKTLDRVTSLEFMHSKDSTSLGQILSCIEQADSGDGVLVLTDLIGASPANMVAEALGRCHAMIVTGVNLAMLIRAYNYRDQPLEKVARKAVDGGKRAVEVFQP